MTKTCACRKRTDAHPEVEFVQIQLNYADWENPVVQSGRLYEILHKRNIPIIVMEPVKGGSLASLTPELEAKYRAAKPEASVASWAVRFVGSLPGVMTILSGMRTAMHHSKPGEYCGVHPAKRPRRGDHHHTQRGCDPGGLSKQVD